MGSVAEISPNLSAQLAKGEQGEPMLVLHMRVAGVSTSVPLDETEMHRLQEATSNAITAALKHRLGREKKRHQWPARAQ